MKKISGETVRADFNDLTAVLHYTRAAHELGLWESERILIERTFEDREAPLLEAGCGAGRVTLGLWSLGYRNLTAFDFAEELVDQARAFAANKNADAIRFHHADATRLSQSNLLGYSPSGPQVTGRGSSNGFRGALFMFNGLMQIPGREHRRTALRELHRVCAPEAPLLTIERRRRRSGRCGDWSGFVGIAARKIRSLSSSAIVISRKRERGAPSCTCRIAQKFWRTWPRRDGSTSRIQCGHASQKSPAPCATSRMSVAFGSRVEPDVLGSRAIAASARRTAYRAFSKS